MQQLAESFCKPVLLYNLEAVNISRSERSRIEYVWNVMMYKIYGVSGESLNFVYALTKCLPICTDLLIRQLNFLKKCVKINNKVVQYVYDCFGQKELLNCVSELGIEDLDVHTLSPRVISELVSEKFVHSCY